MDIGVNKAFDCHRSGTNPILHRACGCSIGSTSFSFEGRSGCHFVK